MAISRKLLADDEQVVVSTRTHVKVLLLPALCLIVTAGLAAYLVAVSDWKWLDYVILILALVSVVWFSLIPFFKWLTTEYTVTNRRLITRTGVLTRKGHDIPMPRISDVASERDLLDRLLGCGTLVLADASDQRVRLHDIPHVEAVSLQIAQLIHPDNHDGT